MLDHRHYIPILLAKQAELGVLATITRDDITPLIELVPKKDTPVLSRLMTVAHALEPPIERGRRVLFDTRLLGSDVRVGGDLLDQPAHPLLFVTRHATGKGYKAAPVVGVGRSPEYIRAARTVIQEGGAGACIRLISRDFDGRLDVAIKNLVSVLEVSASNTDVVIDLQDWAINMGVRVLADQYKTHLQRLPEIGSWRTVTLATGSFPKVLKTFGDREWNIKPRVEWQAFEILAREGRLDRKPSFGDYGVSHPVFEERNGGKAVAHLRYTTPYDFLVYRGREVEGGDYSEFLDIARTLVRREEFRGPDFSWGDNFIAERAANPHSPGTPALWRQVGTSHHLAVVRQQLSMLYAT